MAAYAPAALPKRAGIYCRLSYAPDGSLEKVDRQDGDCRALGDRLGWGISEDHIFKDNSRSAWQRNRKRPDWERMLEAVRNREIDGLLIYHGDRLNRQPWDLELLLHLTDEYPLPLASPSGVRDLSSPDDRFIMRIEAAQACRESDNTSRRVRRGAEVRAKKGLSHGGGKRPFGFGPQVGTRTKVDSTGTSTTSPVYDLNRLRPEETEKLNEAAERLQAGQYQNAVIRWLNTVCTTSQGLAWTPKTLKNLLTSPRVAGLVEHDGILYEAVWRPALGDPNLPEEEHRRQAVEMWEDIKLLYSQSSEERPYAGRERRYLMSGVARCCYCSSTVRTKPSGGRNRRTSRIYNCRGCKKVGRSVEHLDAYIEGRAVRRLNDRKFIAALYDESEQPGVLADIAALQRRKAETQATLEELADHPEVSAGPLVKALASFDRKIAKLRAQRAASARHQLLAKMAGITREQWDATPIDIRSATVAALFEVTILPATWRGPGFDPASVDVRLVDAKAA